MARRALALSALALVAACSSQNKANYAKAGVAIAAAVAEAAVERAVTGRCWGDCQYGTRCDEATGTCVPVENWVDPTPPGPTPPASAASSAPDDSCAGYCLEDERCVIVANGDVQCIAKGPRRP